MIKRKCEGDEFEGKAKFFYTNRYLYTAIFNNLNRMRQSRRNIVGIQAHDFHWR